MASIEKMMRGFDRAHRQVPIAIASLVILAVLMLGSSVVAWRANQEQDRAESWRIHTLDVLLATDSVEIGILNISRGERGYLLTGRQDFLTPLRAGENNAVAALDRLQTLTVDSPLQQRRIAMLRDQTQDYRAIAERTIDLMDQGQSAEALQLQRSDMRTGAVRLITDMLARVRTTELSLADRRVAAVQRASATNRVVLVSVAAAGLFVLLFATLAVVALRSAFQREATYRRELRRRADTDELTGLANRRELLAALDRAIASARRSDGQLAFALLDIDHFKRVNDAHGHPAGDEVIRKIARAALAAVRGCDIVGRLGGEEFGIVLPGAGVAAALGVCERLRERIQSDLIELPGGAGVHVTISTGVARLAFDDSRDALIERADAALYAAKSGGRDQVRLAA